MHIALIGAGVAGTAVFHQLLTANPTEISIISQDVPGCSEAFTGAAQWHLANTSNDTMSLIPGDPQHYTSWLARRGIDTSATFTGRSVFGSYLAETFDAALRRFDERGTVVNNIRDTVTGITQEPLGRPRIALASDAVIEADHVILCTGPGRPRTLSALPSEPSEGYFTTPYSTEFTQVLTANPGARVLILGSKLSAVDAVKTCLKNQASTMMVSRSGQLPSVRTDLALHWAGTSAPDTEHSAFIDFLCASEHPEKFLRHILSSLPRAIDPGESLSQDPLSLLRQELDAARTGRSEWQDLVGPMIEQANLLWPALPEATVKRLKAITARYLNRYVSAIPAESAQALLTGAEQGLISVRGTPHSLRREDRRWIASWGPGRDESFDAVVSALGHQGSPWTLTDDGITATSSAGVLPIAVDLSVRMPGAARNRVWAVGAPTGSRFPVVNYVRTAVVQAERVINQLNTPRQTRHAHRQPAHT
ncbi:FAD/NAD(P)-binding protein [Arthrobacter sp. RCC_34]|uniref:FAD/NAD(P)-binding protein n=1 Tax=Arthrobacter sp. RCC_34 TaxID=3239230 RepID=UPI0035242C3E